MICYDRDQNEERGSKMYLRILKRDLKRKRTMNVILLLFITLATLFVASSVNNIISVTTALDNYFEMANAPDYLGATMNKAETEEIETVLDGMETVDAIAETKTDWYDKPYEEQKMKLVTAETFNETYAEPIKA